MASLRKTTGAAIVALLAGMVSVVGGSSGVRALTVNNLSAPGTTGKIRIFPVFQDGTGATALQQGDLANPATNPNREAGDAWLPWNVTYPFNSPGLRTVGVNPNATDGHTHYHAGDTQIVVDNATGIAPGDTLMVGFPYCNLAFLGLTCKKGAVDEQPLAQIVHVAAVNGTAPAVLDLAGPLVDGGPYCFTASYGACAFLEGTPILKLPTLYQGQQFRVDIPHWDLLNGSAHNVTVTAKLAGPGQSHNPAPVWTPLSLVPPATSVTQALVPTTCGAPTVCGLGVTSFYVPKTATVTATIGNTFRNDTPDTWYTIYVEARDVMTNAVVADGIARFKLNPVAIQNFHPDPQQAFPGESVVVSGFLRDNTSAIGLATRPVEDVIADVDVVQPDILQNPQIGGGVSHYQTTSCVNTAVTGDRCSGGAHGRFAVTFGKVGTGITLPGISAPDCNLLPINVANLLDMAGCTFAPLLAGAGTLIPGSYDVSASLRNFSPAVTDTTSFQVSLIF